MVEPRFEPSTVSLKICHLTIPTGDPNPKMLISSAPRGEVPGGAFGHLPLSLTRGGNTSEKDSVITTLSRRPEGTRPGGGPKLDPRS